MEKPIIFSGEMVNAILVGMKTQTRRVIIPQPPWGKPYFNGAVWQTETAGKMLEYQPHRIGEVLWVRETWVASENGYVYRAVDTNASWKWRPSAYMPRAAARIFLRVTDVRTERLRDITEDDAIAEGFEGIPCDHLGMGSYACTDCMNTGWLEPPTVGFYETWEKLNAKLGYGCDTNPWVWVYTFERVIGSHNEKV